MRFTVAAAATAAIAALSSCNAYTIRPPSPTTPANKLKIPRVIQGGMGIRISKWKLAREVAKQGELGVISGTAMDTVLVRELQAGDPEGSMRRALATFPDQDMVQRLMDKYYIEKGKETLKPFRPIPMWTLEAPQELLEIAVLANYCEVWLAKHEDDGTLIDGIAGINLLTKVQLPTIASLYGAILADVDYVIMGAGIPMHVPGILDNLTEGKDASQKIDVIGLQDEDLAVYKFSPKEFWKKAGKPDMLDQLQLNRPNFLPIVSSVVLAQSMLKRGTGKGETKGIQGFVIELNTAGGHNAPPRGFKYDPVTKTHALDLNERGEPIYGEKDDVDLEKFKKATKDLPFWLAGEYARPDKLKDVMKLGGAGVQCGTMFALSDESGLEENLKQATLAEMLERDLDVFTDPAASPTGFPFKVMELKDSLSEKETYAERPRICNLGYLRTAYLKEDGRIGYRCPSEPIDAFLKKGGELEATVGRKCLCNALSTNCGFPQVTKQGKEPYVEPALITIGDDVNASRQFIEKDAKTGRLSYKASRIVQWIKSELDKAELEQEINIAFPAPKEEAKSSGGGTTTATKVETKVDKKLKP